MKRRAVRLGVAAVGDQAGRLPTAQAPIPWIFTDGREKGGKSGATAATSHAATRTRDAKPPP